MQYADCRRFTRAVILSEAQRSRRTRAHAMRAPFALRSKAAFSGHQQENSFNPAASIQEAANHRTRQLFSADWNRYTLRIAISGSSGCRNRACTVTK
jgi:hypothetical protein